MLKIAVTIILMLSLVGCMSTGLTHKVYSVWDDSCLAIDYRIKQSKDNKFIIHGRIWGDYDPPIWIPLVGKPIPNSPTGDRYLLFFDTQKEAEEAIKTLKQCSINAVNRRNKINEQLYRQSKGDQKWQN